MLFHFIITDFIVKKRKEKKLKQFQTLKNFRVSLAMIFFLKRPTTKFVSSLQICLRRMGKSVL